MRPDPGLTGPIELIDGDTVRLNGTAYRLIGFDTPERGDKAQCDDERRRAENATHRLLDLIATGNGRLTRVACACPPGQEGSRNCNYGRLCGSLRACSGTIAANGGLRSDGVVPVAVELVAKDVDGVHLVIGDFDACRIGVPINFGSHF